MSVIIIMACIGQGRYNRVRIEGVTPATDHPSCSKLLMPTFINSKAWLWIIDHAKIRHFLPAM